MKNRKLVILLLRLLALNLLLTACTNHAVDMSSGESVEQANTDIDYGPFIDDEAKQILTLHTNPKKISGKVGLVVSGTFPYGMGTARMAKDTVNRHFPHLTLIIGNGDSDPVVQSTIIDDFITKKVDVLVIDLTEKDAVNPALERAKAANIPIILIDRWATTEVDTVIKADDIQVGKKAGQKLAEIIGGHGNVVELKGTAGSSTTHDRNHGILDIFSQFPGVQLVASMNADFDQYKALMVMEDVLQRFPKGQLQGLISHADVMTLGAIQAIKAAGREDEIKVVSVDAQEMALDAIIDGKIDATVAYPIVMPMGIIAAAKMLAGEPLPKFIELESPVITKDNASKFIGKTGY